MKRKVTITNLAHHLQRYPQLWETFGAGEQCLPKGRILAHEQFDSVWLDCLQRLDAVDAAHCQFAYGHQTDIRELLHLVGGIVPHSCGQASSQLKSVANCNSILEINMTVDYATYQAVAMRECNSLILIVLPSMLRMLLICRILYATKLRLKQQATLVRMKSEVNFNREFDAVSFIQFPIKTLFAGLESYLTIFLSLRQSGELK